MHPRFTGRSRAWQYALIVGVFAALMLLAGCGSNAGAASNSTSSSDARASALQFTRCMRDHGINVSDPQVSGSGGGVSVRINGSSGVNPDSTQFQQAENACKKYLPNGGQLSPQQQAQFQQKALAYARCMRAHGVDVPDPQVSSGGGLRLPNNINPDDPHVQQAQKACESILGNPGGSGPSTSKGGNG
jgi:hypothetical protein